MRPSATRVPIFGLDPETVRTRLELGMIKRLRHHLSADWSSAPPDYERTSAALEVDACLDSLTAEPRVGAVVEEVRRVLGVEREVEVHPTRERIAAAHRTVGGPLVVSLHWRVLAALDDDALLAVIGHELGHHLAHNGIRPDGPDPYFVYSLWHADRRSEIRETAAAYSRAAELSADRFALLACQDLGALLRLFASFSDDVSVREQKPSSFLIGSKKRADELLACGQRAEGDSHPEIAVRAYAAWLFSESDAYRRLTRRGSGGRSLLEIDMRLAGLIGPDEDRFRPVDDPTWMDGIGEALSERSDALGKALGSHAARIGAALGGTRARAKPPADERREKASAVDVPEMDDLEARFAALERSMGAGKGTAE